MRRQWLSGVEDMQERSTERMGCHVNQVQLLLGIHAIFIILDSS
jgi:hypothetical protein